MFRGLKARKKGRRIRCAKEIMARKARKKGRDITREGTKARKARESVKHVGTSGTYTREVRRARNYARYVI